MVAEISERTARLRAFLAQRPESIRVGDLPPGTKSSGPGQLPSDLDTLLSITDGPRCGTVVLFSRAEIASSQYFADILDGGRERWLSIGTYDTTPLMLERSSGGIYWDERDEGELSRIAANILEFFKDYLIGARYSLLGLSENDPWQKILTEFELTGSR